LLRLLPRFTSRDAEAVKTAGAIFALLHGFSHAHRPANPTFAVYHLPAFTRPHSNQEAALAPPLNLTLAMIFHALSPNFKKPTDFTTKNNPGNYTPYLP